jgi:hypothetical protein
MGFLLAIMFVLVGAMLGFFIGGMLGAISSKQSVMDGCGCIGGFVGAIVSGILGIMAIMGM